MAGSKKLFQLYVLLVAIVTTSAQATDYHVAKTGLDTNPGTEASPFLTIQRASYAALTPGDRVIVHAGTYTELENDLVDGGLAVTAIQPHADGITFMAAPGEHVIIDQQHIPVESPPGTWTLPVTTANGYEPAGFATNKYDDIVIDGFEIKNAATGIMTGNLRSPGGAFPDPDTNGVMTERTIIKNNHIHHINSAGNVAAISLAVCRDCEVYDNVLHDVSKVLGGVKYCVNATECPGFPVSQNTSGLLSYGMERPRIFNNAMYNAYNGVYHKRAARIEGDVGGDGGSIHNNAIYDTVLGISHSVAGACDYAHKAVRIYENLFYHVNYSPMSVAISATVYDAANPSGLMVIYNNTIQANTGVFVDAFEDTRIFNNVFDLTNSGGTAIARYERVPDQKTCSEPQNAYRTIGSVGYPFNSTFTLSDYNLVNPGSRFRVADNFYSLSTWQAGGTGNCRLNALSGFCGQNSVQGDPLFASTPKNGAPVNGQYFTLSAGSPAKSRGRANVDDLPAGAPVDMGAYPKGLTGFVGPRRIPGPVSGVLGSSR